MSSNIDQIINNLSIVDVVSEYLELQKKGNNYWGVCPFHEDTNPSMSVSDKKQMFKCFVCNKGGNVINFVSEFEKIPFQKALKKLSKRAGFEYVEKEYFPKYSEAQQKIIDALKDANDYFMLSLNSTEGEDALNYAKSRDLALEISEKFSIGYSGKDVIDFLKKKGHDEATLINASLINSSEKPFFKNRLMFGIKNEHGDIVGFSGRSLNNEKPKYINSIESQVFNKSSILYNYSNAIDNISKLNEVYITEGFMDVIALDKSKYHNVIAIMGTALTKSHLTVLRNKNIKLLLDSDDAGIKATLKSIYLLLSNSFKPYVIKNSSSKDPDDIFRNGGAKAIDELLKNEHSCFSFLYEWLKEKINPTTPDKIELFFKKFKNFLKYGNSLEKDFYVNKMVKDLKISQDSIVIPVINRDKSYSIISTENNSKNKIAYHPNYSFQLIKSLIKKPFLAKVLVEKKHAQLNDPIILGIVKFLVASALKQKATISEEAKKKLLAIDKLEIDYAKNEKEFIDIIKIINKKWNNELKSKIKVKLKETNNDKEIADYLEQLRKIGKV